MTCKFFPCSLRSPQKHDSPLVIAVTILHLSGPIMVGKMRKDNNPVMSTRWKNFLSAQTLKAIDSLRKQFFSLLKDTWDLVDKPSENCNSRSIDEHLMRADHLCWFVPSDCALLW
ncbi:hypothetical protein OIU78_029589 [Salix suchowensis]|nr:hypothetical protein OIU78_029589 [Salix suchowensis]